MSKATFYYGLNFLSALAALVGGAVLKLPFTMRVNTNNSAQAAGTQDITATTMVNTSPVAVAAGMHCLKGTAGMHWAMDTCSSDSTGSTGYKAIMD